MTTPVDGWSEFEQLSELELWQAVVSSVEGAETQKAFNASWLSDDAAATSETWAERFEIRANMAAFRALLLRFPDTARVEILEDSEPQRIRLTLDLLGVSDAVAQPTPRRPAAPPAKTRARAARRAAAPRAGAAQTALSAESDWLATLEKYARDWRRIADAERGFAQHCRERAETARPSRAAELEKTAREAVESAERMEAYAREQDAEIARLTGVSCR